MARNYRDQKKRGKPVGDANDPEGLYVWTQRYLEWLRVRNFSEWTLKHRELHILSFIEWLDARGIGRPTGVTKGVLERYQGHLFHYRKKNGKPLSFHHQTVRLVGVRALFKWLTKQNVIPANPASELELPKRERRLPVHLTEQEVERVMREPDLSDALGVRDRALLEVLYSTGIRRSEAIGLSLYDIDDKLGTLRIRQGKGKKDRVVPIGERALRWVEKYAHDARPSLVVPPETGRLFLTNLGDELNPEWLSKLVREYLKRAEIEKRGSCHLFRHTVATLMLDNGADIRFIQEMLGHASVATTELYTHVSVKQLCEVHRRTHPGAAFMSLRKTRGADASEADMSDAETKDADTSDADKSDAETTGTNTSDAET